MRLALTTLLVLLLGGCAVGFKVTGDYNVEYDFSGQSTYAIVLPEGIETVPNPLVARRVMRALRAELDEKGLVEVPSAEADVHFSFITTSQDREDIRVYQNYNSYFAYRNCWNCRVYNTTVMPATEVTRVEYIESQMIIDAVHPETRELFWRGMTNKKFTRGEVSSMKPDRLTRLVDKAVDAILKNYPPQ